MSEWRNERKNEFMNPSSPNVSCICFKVIFVLFTTSDFPHSWSRILSLLHLIDAQMLHVWNIYIPTFGLNVYGKCRKIIPYIHSVYLVRTLSPWDVFIQVPTLQQRRRVLNPGKPVPLVDGKTIQESQTVNHWVFLWKETPVQKMVDRFQRCCWWKLMCHHLSHFFKYCGVIAPRYPFILPFQGVIAPFITGRCPPCRISSHQQLEGKKTSSSLSHTSVTGPIECPADFKRGHCTKCLVQYSNFSSWNMSWWTSGVLLGPLGRCTWKAKCPIFKAIVAGFRGKVA